MPPFTFFIIPILTVFLLIELGLVAKGVADLSVGVKGFEDVGDNPVLNNPNFSSEFSNLFGSSSFTFSQFQSGSSARKGSSSITAASSSASNSNLFSFPSDSATGLGSFPTDDSGSGLATDDGSYESQLNSLLSQYSLAGFTRRAAVQPTPTSAPLLRRAIVVQPTPVPIANNLIKRQNFQGLGSVGIAKDAKSKLNATLAFYVLQLVCIVILLGLIVAFLLQHKKYHKGGFTYDSHHFFHSFTVLFAIVTGFYFLFGLISYALLGSFAGGLIIGIAAAAVSFWVFSFVLLLGLLFTLKWDARKMERGETGTNEKVVNDGGEIGHPQPVQQVQPQQNHIPMQEQPQSHQHYVSPQEQPQSHQQYVSPQEQPPHSMPEPHVQQ